MGHEGHIACVREKNVNLLQLQMPYPGCIISILHVTSVDEYCSVLRTRCERAKDAVKYVCERRAGRGLEVGCIIVRLSNRPS